MTDEMTQVLGWAAAGLVLTSFYLKTMIPLRMVAMLGNLVFIAYGLRAGATPIVVLHALLFPLNAVRLFQMRALTLKVRTSARGQMSMSMLLPYMKHTTMTQGTEIFKKGDDSSEVYYIISGAVRILEVDRVVRAGNLLGEMGVFTEDYKRTGTAMCETDVELGSISVDKFWETFFQDPTFGAYLIRTIVQRSTSNVEWASSTYGAGMDSRFSTLP